MTGQGVSQSHTGVVVWEPSAFFFSSTTFLCGWVGREVGGWVGRYVVRC